MNKSTRLLISVRAIVKCRFYSYQPKNWSEHPYGKIHPWKSQREFSRFLLNNIIYNYDGLVAINKPYGIPLALPDHKKKKPEQTKNVIIDAKDYNIEESLDYMAVQLNYPDLKIIQAPERHISGVTLLAANSKAEKKAIASLRCKLHEKNYPLVYWIVTTKLPREVNGKRTLGLTMQKHSLDPKLKAVKYFNTNPNDNKRIALSFINVYFKLKAVIRSVYIAKNLHFINVEIVLLEV